MFFYLYEIRNNLTGKIYVGVHKTNNIDDGYMGSGKIIRRAIRKYGIENFSKVILETFENAEAMYAREKEIVTEDFLDREDVYNLRRGGTGGFDYINKSGKNLYGKNGTLGYGGENLSSIWSRENLSDLDRKEISRKAGKTLSEKFKSGELIPTFVSNNPMNSEVAREKQKATFKEIDHQKGEKNSQFGTMWVNDGVKSFKIRKTDNIPDGVVKGRLPKNTSPL